MYTNIIVFICAVLLGYVFYRIAVEARRSVHKEK